VTLLCAPVEEAAIPGRADAALFHFTHDVLRRSEAIANVLRHLKPGARVVASGLKWAAPWAPGVPSPVKPVRMAAAAHSVTSFDGLGRPWSLLQAQLGALDVEPALLDRGLPSLGRAPVGARFGTHSSDQAYVRANDQGGPQRSSSRLPRPQDRRSYW